MESKFHVIAIATVVFGVLLFVAPQGAKADTFCSGGNHDESAWGGGQTLVWDNCLYTYTANLDNSAYVPSGKITVTGSITTDMCGNEQLGVDGVYDYATLAGAASYDGAQSYTVASGEPTAWDLKHGFTFGNTVAGTAYYTAPAASGNYSINFTGTGWYVNGPEIAVDTGTQTCYATEGGSYCTENYTYEVSTTSSYNTDAIGFSVYGPTGTISSLTNPCYISSGGTTCDPTFDWSTSYTNGVVQMNIVGGTYSTETGYCYNIGTSGTGGKCAALAPGTYTLKLYGENGAGVWALLDSKPTTVTCASGLTWYGSSMGCLAQPPAPTNPQSSCNSDGTQATFSWTPASGYTTYYTRAQLGGTGPGSGGTYLGAPAWSDTFSGPPYSVTFSITPNTLYWWWVHTRDPNNQAWSNYIGGQINCPGGVGSSCTSNAQCASGLVCTGGVCVSPVSATLSGEGCVLGGGQTTCNVDTWWTVGTLPSGDTLGLQVSGPDVSLLRTGPMMAATPESYWVHLANLAASAIRGSLPNTVSQSSPHQEAVGAGTFAFQLQDISGSNNIPVGNQLSLVACPSGDYIVKDPTTGNEQCASLASNPPPSAPSCQPGGHFCQNDYVYAYDNYCSSYQYSSTACPNGCLNGECQAPTAPTLTANPTLVHKGGQTTVSWSVQDVKQCGNITGDGQSISAGCTPNADGSTVTCTGSHMYTIQDQATFSTSCTNLLNQPVAVPTAIVNVIPGYQEK